MLAQVPGGAQRWMSGEGQLFIHCEDADLVALLLLDWPRTTVHVSKLWIYLNNIT